MTAVLDSDHKTIDCPHCKGKLNVEIEREPANVKVPANFRELPDIEAIIEKKFKEREPKKEEKPKKEKILAPGYLPKWPCKGENCEGHANENYKEKPKRKCANGDCGQYVPNHASRCLWCGSKDEDGADVPFDDRFEEIDADVLRRIPDPQHSHSHEEHEHE